VSPPDSWTSLSHCKDDFTQATAALIEAERDPASAGPLFSIAAEAMVRVGERGVLGISLLLLNRTTVERPALVTQLSTYLSGSAAAELASIRAGIDAA
jgi:hypothetical protein